MENTYKKAKINELGAIRDLTQGDLNGTADDNILITVDVAGVGPVTVFGTVSGIPVP